MKAALISEFTTIKNIFWQMVLTYFIVGLVFSVIAQSTLMLVGCLGAMTPIMLLFTLTAYDEQNGWERFRGCLPVSRGAIVQARYAILLLTSIALLLIAVALGMLIVNLVPLFEFVPEDIRAALAAENDLGTMLLVCGAGVGATLLMAALLLPFAMRYGQTRALRHAPLAFCALALAAVWILPNFANAGGTEALLAFLRDPGNGALIGIVAASVLAAVYVGSCALAMRLYRAKEL